MFKGIINSFIMPLNIKLNLLKSRFYFKFGINY